MVTAIRFQILDEADCISHSTNTLRKGWNSIILPQAVSKLKGRLGSLILVRPPVKEKENSEFKNVKLRSKIDLVTHFASLKGVSRHTHTHTHTHTIYIYIYIHIYIRLYFPIL